MPLQSFRLDAAVARLKVEKGDSHTLTLDGIVPMAPNSHMIINNSQREDDPRIRNNGTVAPYLSIADLVGHSSRPHATEQRVEQSQQDEQKMHMVDKEQQVSLPLPGQATSNHLLPDVYKEIDTSVPLASQVSNTENVQAQLIQLGHHNAVG